MRETLIAFAITLASIAAIGAVVGVAALAYPLWPLGTVIGVGLLVLAILTLQVRAIWFGIGKAQ